MTREEFYQKAVLALSTAPRVYDSYTTFMEETCRKAELLTEMVFKEESN